MNDLLNKKKPIKVQKVIKVDRITSDEKYDKALEIINIFLKNANINPIKSLLELKDVKKGDIDKQKNGDYIDANYKNKFKVFDIKKSIDIHTNNVKTIRLLL